MQQESIKGHRDISHLQLEDKEIYLLGTAHVSKESADLVRRAVEEIQPEQLCIELCPGRLESIENPERWRNTDIFMLIKQGKSYVLLSQIILSAFQKRLAKQFGIRAGEEMHVALELARTNKIPLVVIDRDIKVTLKRAWARAGLFSALKSMFGLLVGIFSNEDISAEQLEEMKHGDALAGVMSEFSTALPQVKQVLIDERDRIMAQRLKQASSRRILAVVGAGHVPGIKQHIFLQDDISELETLAPPSPWSRLSKYLFPGLLISILIYFFYAFGAQASFKMFGVWAITNMICTAIGAIICLAHPLTVLVAFLSAPFAAIHPVIAVGWLSALSEAFLRKPRVKDFETVIDDLSHLKSFWTNRLCRIFLIMIATNLASILGTILGLWLAGHSLSS